MLHWETTCDGQPTCRYDIKYKLYGIQEWQRMKNCDKMKNLCNMTAELLKKENVYEKIFAKVKAKNGTDSSSWEFSEEFKILRDTTISAPALTVTASSTTILVSITAPLLLHHLKYTGTDHQKKMSFSINVSASSKLIKTENTEETKWNITDLPLGNYCITVNMKYGEITSRSSPQECVEIEARKLEKLQQ
ncbi:interferon alpha/beta receptor 1-like [Dendrobates tinctorius]|uniref:interferon alpha/beta receptor 1-like n=1 Tax=Dendrobates tinctorius TaxID=92724 RepID=UPI003CC9DF24